ncbi:hypothetical protein [Burkholderia oklahomensis]|uniref:hypothetical protein n=1 Tax=Burkholderia oklahomensis TaxID=342113 RepID=UPI000A765F52|nr:hypothetical protein [Burkholderia oklahomensis]MBI0361394.1 hypothetical protein [Burkholderia oklahomensis]
MDELPLRRPASTESARRILAAIASRGARDAARMHECTQADRYRRRRMRSCRQAAIPQASAAIESIRRPPTQRRPITFADHRGCPVRTAGEGGTRPNPPAFLSDVHLQTFPYVHFRLANDCARMKSGIFLSRKYEFAFELSNKFKLMNIHMIARDGNM